MRKTLIRLVIAMTLLHGGSVYARAYQQHAMESTGIVESINHKGYTMIVSDVRFRVADYVVIRGRNKKSISLNRLRHGDKIGFSTSSVQAGGAPTIIEIQLLPDSYGTLE